MSFLNLVQERILVLRMSSRVKWQLPSLSALAKQMKYVDIARGQMSAIRETVLSSVNAKPFISSSYEGTAEKHRQQHQCQR